MIITILLQLPSAFILGNTTQFAAHTLSRLYSVILHSVILPKNSRQYSKHSLKFLDKLTKILTAQSVYRNYAVLPLLYFISSSARLRTVLAI